MGIVMIEILPKSREKLFGWLDKFGARGGIFRLEPRTIFLVANATLHKQGNIVLYFGNIVIVIELGIDYNE